MSAVDGRQHRVVVNDEDQQPIGSAERDLPGDRRNCPIFFTDIRIT
jgi:hypothetical protein